MLDERLIGRPGVFALGPAAARRWTCAERGSTGTRIGTLMREQDDVNLELVSENVIVAVFGIGEDVTRSASRLVDGLRHAVETLGSRGGAAFRAPHSPAALGCAGDAPEAGVPRGAGGRPLRRAVGRIAAESLAAYPPGIPNVLPGERLTRETVDYINEVVEHGGWVRGAVDRSLKTMRVVVE